MAHIKEILSDNNKNKRFKAAIESEETNQNFGETKHFETKKDAERWLNNMLNSNNKNLKNNKSIITVGEQLDNWLKGKEPFLTKAAYNRHNDIINRHLKPYFGNLSLQELKLQDIKEYLDLKKNNYLHSHSISDNHRLTEKNIQSHYSILNEMLKNAVELKLIRTNPLENFEFPYSKTAEAPVMTPEECNELLRAAEEDPFMYSFIYTSLVTGLRRNELLGLEWCDINFEEKYIEVKQRLIHEGPNYTIKKIRTTRKVKINEQVVKKLKKHKIRQNNMKLKNWEEYNKKNHFVFSNSLGNPYHPLTYTKKFKNILNKSSLNGNYQIHTLRNTYFSLKGKIKNPEFISYFFATEHATHNTLLLYGQRNQLEN